MKAKQIKLCVVTGPFVALFLFVALWPLAHFIPPPSPTESAEWYHSFYTENLLGVRLAGIFLLLSSTLTCMVSGGLATLIKIMEGKVTPWTYVFLLAGAAVAITFFMSGVFFCVAAFRPERSPDLLYILSDMAWITILIPVFPATLQLFALGFATLGDKRRVPIFPRWSAYVNFWIGIIYIPGCFVAMFQTGPFAWDGLLAFWLPAVFFGTWFFIMSWIVFARITDELLESVA